MQRADGLDQKCIFVGMAEPSMMEAMQISPDLLQERGSDTLFQRRIEFQLARRPFTGFESYRNDGCKLITLNPNAETHKNSNSSDKAKCLETAVDPDLTFEITFRRIVSS
ncbi:hypothetical protein M569_11463 [Genlisea aurea]|uniref:Uncharacterized protein n=1 Tax=Genlisea aurea TaxID=192259 RepID=S8DKB4_9LAMI|nr:hypothetical protein M569_11463 [Genlisea aurea]